MNTYPVRHGWTEIPDIIPGISFLRESREASSVLHHRLRRCRWTISGCQAVTVNLKLSLFPLLLRVYSSREEMKCTVESGPYIVLPGDYLRPPNHYCADLGTTKISTDTTTRPSLRPEVRESDTFPHVPSFTGLELAHPSLT